VTEIRTTDEVIESILSELDGEVNRNNLRADWKGDFFSSNQLDDLRRVFEKSGYEIARIFISGKMTPKGNQFELKKNEIILLLLDRLHAAKSLDMSTKSYIIGKLNSILTVYRKGGKIS
jgi:hypothetical protein